MARRLMARVVTLVLLAAGLGVAAAAVPAGAQTTVQRLGYCGGDDWEPAMASDNSGHVYVLITHYAGSTACDAASGANNSRIMIQVSSDGGKTFSAPAVVADAPGGISSPKQADPSIVVGQATGDVYVSFLAYGLSGGHTDIYVARSTDHGST